MDTSAMFFMGVSLGFVIGYALGLFIDKLDKKEKARER
jgi:NhaP-type Na+/H+ or K+/H+ antiporter